MNNARSIRYECTECGKQIDLHAFWSPHHAGVGCVECWADMECVGRVGEDGTVEEVA